MSRGQISDHRPRPTSDECLAALGAEASAWRARSGLTLAALAEKFGKSADRDAATAYCAGERDPGAVGLLVAMYEDEPFANALLGRLLNRRLCPVEVEHAEPDQLARELARFLAMFLEAIAVDEDRDGDPLDRRDVLKLDRLIAALMPHLAAIQARAAKIKEGGR